MDRRVKRTKKILYDSLIFLLKEKDLNKITVKELTELADVNRKTFYLHYKDIYDMLDQIKDAILEDFKELVLKHSNIDESTDDLYTLLEDVISFTNNHYDLFNILLGTSINSDMNFINKLKIVMKERCVNLWINMFPKCDMKTYDYFYSFAFQGFIGIVQNWIDTNREDSIEYISKLSTEMFYNCGNVLKNQKEVKNI